MIQTVNKNPKISNLKPFAKGKSGNPKGRPKSNDLRSAALEVLAKSYGDKTVLEGVLETLAGLALSGNIRAAETLLDRAYGKPVQSIEADIDGAPPFSVQIITPASNLPTDD